jgi:hypothetical protein
MFRRLRWPASWHGRAVLFASTWSLALVSVTYWKNHDVRSPAIDRPLALAEDGYVGSAACRACHPGNYASWHASFHRTMTQPATPANVIPSIDHLELTLDRTVYHVERRGDVFTVRQRAVDAPVAELGEAREIVLLTGSHHQQNFWLVTGAARTLEPFPFAWLVAEKTWVPVGDSFLAPPELHDARGGAGAWNNGCLHCHATHGRSRGRSDGTFDSRVAEFGIACEACHGEGREHIARHHNPIRRYLAHLHSTPDPTIANPARMSGPASALACGQCHSIWAFDCADAEMAANRNGAKFRPGTTSLVDRFVAQPFTADHAASKQKLRDANPYFFEDSYWPDGMVRVTGREYNGVELSPCFKGGAFSCLSCHEMHPAQTDRDSLQTWAVSQMRSVTRGDHACVQCHQKIGANISAHTHHAADSPGSRCYDCHMPHTGFGLLRAVRSHQVSSPSVSETLHAGRPNACNLCHLDQPLAWTAERLHAWYDHALPALSSDDRNVAAGAKWLLKGDAGQRALVAWSMGWAPAQKASGRDWLAPYLAITLNDPYAAVRYVAWKSLQTLSGFEAFPFTYTADDATTFDAANRAYQHSLELRRGKTDAFASPLLLDPSGRFHADVYQRLLDERDNRRIYLVE